jgi:hypothetical protein
MGNQKRTFMHIETVKINPHYLIIILSDFAKFFTIILIFEN